MNKTKNRNRKIMLGILVVLGLASCTPSLPLCLSLILSPENESKIKGSLYEEIKIKNQLKTLNEESIKVSQEEKIKVKR